VLNTDSHKASHCLPCPRGHPVALATEVCAAHGVPFNRDGFDCTGDNAGLPLKLHDFGADGMSSSLESALLGGVTHLVNFQGTDPDSRLLGALLQIVNRDEQRFAMKCPAVQVQGRWRDVFKDRATDPGKRSKAGA
jgi:Nicotinate phosphoribosyltransferase (NAPRTase) family